MDVNPARGRESVGPMNHELASIAQVLQILRAGQAKQKQ